MKDKWKQFSIGFHFNNDLTGAEAVALFDELQDASSSEETEAILTKHLVWENFRSESPINLVSSVYNLAEHAQEVEALA